MFKHLQPVRPLLDDLARSRRSLLMERGESSALLLRAAALASAWSSDVPETFQRTKRRLRSGTLEPMNSSIWTRLRKESSTAPVLTTDRCDDIRDEAQTSRSASPQSDETSRNASPQSDEAVDSTRRHEIEASERRQHVRHPSSARGQGDGGGGAADASVEAAAASALGAVSLILARAMASRV